MPNKTAEDGFMVKNKVDLVAGSSMGAAPGRWRIFLEVKEKTFENYIFVKYFGRTNERFRK